MTFIQELFQGKKSAKSLLEHSYVKDCMRDVKDMKQDWLITQLQKQIMRMKETYDQEMGKAERKMEEKLDKLRHEFKEKTKEIQDIKKQLKNKSDKMDEEMKSFLNKQLQAHQHGKNINKDLIKISWK